MTAQHVSTVFKRHAERRVTEHASWETSNRYVGEEGACQDNSARELGSKASAFTESIGPYPKVWALRTI